MVYTYLMEIIKSIGAVVAGFLVVAIFSTGTDQALEFLGWYPEGGMGAPIMLLAALAYRSVYAIAGGYVTAMLSPSNPLKLVQILAYIGVVLSIVGIFVGWKFGNQWYPILLALTAYPLVMLGGKLQTKEVQHGS